MSTYSKSELNEMLAQAKVYCFAYDLEDDKVYGEGSFEDISVSVEDVVNEALQVTKTDEGTTIYLYTFKATVS